MQVLSAIGKVKEADSTSDLSVVLSALQSAGFKASIRTTSVPSSEPTQGQGTSILRRLQHRFIVLSRGFLEYVVDVDFRQNFELPYMASNAYTLMLESLPSDFVGTRVELSLLVAHISQSMAQEFVRKVNDQLLTENSGACS